MRDAPSLDVIPALLAAGAKVRAYDPEGRVQAEPLLPGVTCCENPYEAMTAADVVAILTEWNEFRALDLERTKTVMQTPVMVDLRNIYNPVDMVAAGFRYSSVGRPLDRPGLRQG